MKVAQTVCLEDESAETQIEVLQEVHLLATVKECSKVVAVDAKVECQDTHVECLRMCKYRVIYSVNGVNHGFQLFILEFFRIHHGLLTLMEQIF